MAAVMQALPFVGSFLQAGGAHIEGQQAKAAANYDAAQLEQQALQVGASSQREAIEARRQARLAGSRLQAVAQGGGEDPTVVKLAADLAGEGEYRALTAIYEGKERSIGMQQQARVRRYEGAQAGRAGNLRAVSSLMGSASSMYSKYGGGGAS